MSTESLLRKKLSPKEKETYYEIFRIFDVNKKGSFGVKELLDVMKSYGMNPNEQEVLEMILVVNTNNSGRISFEEFLDVFVKRLKDSSEAQQELREAFRVFDKESNGFIPKDELIQVLTELGDKLTDEEVQEMINEVSSDSNQNFNYEEFITLMTSAHK